MPKSYLDYETIFNDEGEIHPVEPEWLTPKKSNKICVKILMLSHYIQQLDIPPEIKKEILGKNDSIYYSAKRIAARLYKYRHGEI